MSMAGQIGITVENAALFQETKTRAKELSALYSVATVVNESLDLGSLLRSVMEKVLEIFDFDAARIYLYDENKKELHLLAHQGFPQDAYPEESYPPGVGVIGKVFETGEPRFFEDIQNDPEFRRLAYKRIALRAGFRGGFFIPIRVKDKTVGVINFVSKNMHQFPSNEVQLIHSIANHVGIAVENSQLYERSKRQAFQLQADVAELRKAEEEICKLNEGLEQRVLQRTAELEASNKELEAFSYSVSHDLRAPLRAINGFSRIILEDHASQINPKTQHYLRLVGDNSQQMGNLIDDLLTFSRLNRQPVERQSVATAEVVDRVLKDMDGDREGRRIDITIGDLPVCQGDPALLKLVFLNLISNAFKFTRRREVAVIGIGCRGEGSEWVYFVRDNGVAFDMRYADKLFGVFQRLHRAEDYEGTGVGLATVQRIIQRHGGRVWAEAEVDKGATFYFTLGGGTRHDK